MTYERSQASRLAPLAGVAALLLACAGFGLAAVVLPGEKPLTLQEPKAVTRTDVAPTAFADEIPAEVSVVTGPPTPVRAPRDGVVTSLACPVGAPLESGTPLFEIDGEPVLGIATSVPLWRDITVGDRGADVRALEAELSRLRPGTTTEDGRWGRDDDASFQFLRKANGVMPEHGGVHLEQLAWIPAPTPVVACPTGAGTVIATGDETMVLPAPILGATVRLAKDADPEVPRVLQVNGQDFLLPMTGVISDRTMLDALASSSEFARAQSESPVALQFTTRRSEPLATYAVPPTALYKDEAGSSCVRSDTGAVRVEVVASELGLTLISTGDTIITWVSLSPPNHVRC